MKKSLFPVLAAIAMSGCNSHSGVKDSEIITNTAEHVIDTLGTENSSNVVLNIDTSLDADAPADTLDNIVVSKSLIDKAMKYDGDISMKQILPIIQNTNDWENAKYIASTYKNYGYGTDAIGVMVKIAGALGDFEKAKYVASHYQGYGYGGDAIGLMVRIGKVNKSWEQLEYVASNYQKYGYAGDAIEGMYNIAHQAGDWDKLNYIAQTYTKYGYASDCFVSMYELYTKNPSPDMKSILVILAKKEYTLRAPMAKQGQPALIPERQKALDISKILLRK